MRGKGRFHGQGVYSEEVFRTCSPLEVNDILDDLYRDIEIHGGLTPVQVFDSLDGRVLLAIDRGDTWTLEVVGARDPEWLQSLSGRIELSL